MLGVDVPEEEWIGSNDSSVDIAIDDLWGNQTGRPSVTEDDVPNQAMSTLSSALVWGSVLTFLCVLCGWSIYREYRQQAAEQLEREVASPPGCNKEGATFKAWNEYFAERGCQMTVSAKEHIVATDTEDIEQPPNPSDPELPTDVDVGDNEGVGYLLMIPPKQATNGNSLRVPNCCVICMDSYKDGEEVVWSKDTECRHVFHRDCFVDYLASRHKEGKEDRSCPTCRRDFCDPLDHQPAHAVNSEMTVPPMASETEP
eukprot:Nitzschia sp. Nitz4//scaffold414_size9364//3988//4847//NITZ4_009099-RA/size9364-augustus-gene-0.2-mRNA-1//-1//CDS//3329551350//9086//frame0